MTPTGFDEDNSVLDPPPGVVCASLSVWRGESDGTPMVISCWKPSREELDEIVRTGRVWAIVVGETMPPIAVQGISPFMKKPEDKQ